MSDDQARVTAAGLVLREVVDSDLPIFFVHQQDAEAVRMAAFTHEDPSDRAAFDAHWAKIRAVPGVINRTIVVAGEVVGHVASFGRDNEREVTYWIGREHWGRGIASGALAKLLEIETTRPLHARAAADNLASVRVLEKCGFRVVRRERGFAQGRGREIEEVVCRLG